MNKRFLLLTAALLFIGGVDICAQNNKGVKVVTANEAIHSPNSSGHGFAVQVGRAYLGLNENGDRSSELDIRFPWDVNYLYNTFSEESFEVTKGIFPDKIELRWTIRNNETQIENFKLFRRKVNMPEEPFTEIVTLPSSATTYDDRFVDGGTLYEYKLKAEGIVARDVIYENFITGIGFRNPEATITGNISYVGGNPVKDVKISVTSNTNSEREMGSSLLVPELGRIFIQSEDRGIEDVMTLQAWVKPEEPFDFDDDSVSSGRSVKLFTVGDGFGVRPEEIEVWLFPVLDNDAGIGITINTRGFTSAIYRLKNYIPSGELDELGNDILVPIENINSEFTHITVALKDGEWPKIYINGRPLTEDYFETVHSIALENDENYNAPYVDFDAEQLRVPSIAAVGGRFLHSGAYKEYIPWNTIELGWDEFEAKSFYCDEIRIWDKILEADDIRFGYQRRINNNDPNLFSYLKANEGVGEYAYDLSRYGFTYNENHGKLENVSWITEGYISDQTGIQTITLTDDYGNYVAEGIPYSGSGEAVTLTPILGQHQFDPAQQTLYVGEGSEIINQVNFTDKSSFVFRGRVLFDTRDVFKSFVEVNSQDPEAPDFSNLTEGDEYVSGPGILDEGYNYYEKSGLKYPKGEYWLNDAGTPDDSDDDYLERYARIPSVGANIYIDGELVLNENREPVITDNNGEFEINVPIGNHFISVRKHGHEFAYNGRFPQNKGEYHNFFENMDEPIYFVDYTKVTVVGRVTGGSVESQKEIGFGYNGLREESISVDGVDYYESVSSVNNIGVASITLDYTPPGANPTPYTKASLSTNDETGEYRVNLLPLEYTINQQSGLIINSNPTLSLLDANEIFSVSNAAVEETVPEIDLGDNGVITDLPYHYARSFVYRSTPVLRVTEQTSDSEINIDEESFSTEGMPLLFTQFKSYEITMDRFERYVNYDEDSGGTEYLVPIIDGVFNITNNLALNDSESIEIDQNDMSKIVYRFKAGLPAISSPFTRTLDIKYSVDGVDYDAENYEAEGIILGGRSDGSQTFITAAPDVPDIILRDPPGSNSFATIESGESISFSTSQSFTQNDGFNQSIVLLLGAKFEAGGGLAGPVITQETTNNIELGVSFSSSSSDGKDLTKTYTFNQSISTSDDPEFVGADGDLYIGQSKNYAYGSFNNVQANMEPIGDDTITLTNIEGETLYISTQKAMYFNEEPSETFFVYSQYYILETLIPELELIVFNIENGILDENDPSLLSVDDYQQQIYLWRKTILENERTKHLAINRREEFKETLQNYAENIVDDIRSDDVANEKNPGFAENIENTLNRLLNEHYEDNISFDAGSGEFSRSMETSILSSKQIETTYSIEESVALSLGFAFNKFGVLSTTTATFAQDFVEGNSAEEETVTSVSFTLKDNDGANALSVDVVNSFDGNGLIFGTVGGSTSCPHEGATTTLFYDHQDYDPSEIEIEELEEGAGEEISRATQQVEVPIINVEQAVVNNVFETVNAEFELTLENNGLAGTDELFLLVVDNTTNPHNAHINIDPNGTIVNVPIGERVTYTMTLGKSISDVYSYENISIFLSSLCDDDVYDQVVVSANFVPSCSEIFITSPLENWSYNINAAHNLDGTTNPMVINMEGFNQGFSNFKQVDLEYRVSGTPTWTRLHTYFNTEEFYSEAQESSTPEISLIDNPILTYSWDIKGRGLEDGGYEVRARTSCTNGTEFISEVIPGKIDLNSPRRFGVPSPIDGILTSGEVLKARFSENINYNSAVSNIEIKGETNQLPVNHHVSLRFEGSNTALIESPMITNGDFALEFWMKNNTQQSNATIIEQENGFKIGLDDTGRLFFTLGEQTISGSISDDNLFHHYTFSYDSANEVIHIFEEANIIASEYVAPLRIANNNDLIIGGHSFVGNIHDVRLWNKAIDFEDSFANIYTKYIGNEQGLIGLWSMDEGNGNIAKDKARFKHALVNSGSWDINPKGNAYEFINGQYLTLDNVNFVQITEQMDVTLSFWLKTDRVQDATIFSNGRGDQEEADMFTGSANKWAINLNNQGYLSIESEGTSTLIVPENIADDSWHHISILINRQGTVRTYLDAELVSSVTNQNIKGFTGNKIWIGARGNMIENEQADRTFTGKIDELRLWNLLRTYEQIERDRFNEIDPESIGLMLYAKMNQPDIPTGNGPRYYHIYSNQNVIPSNAIISDGNLNYSEDTPAIKPSRSEIKFLTNHVINDDEIIIEPVISDWASIESQRLDITVHRMFDGANNIQESPITWTAFVNRNDVSWYAEGYGNTVDIISNIEASNSFDLVLLNRGGQNQPYTITNIPSWLTLEETSGIINPNSSITIKATIDFELSTGEFTEELYLQTNFGFDQKIQLNVRILSPEPDWNVDASKFDNSMNVIGRIKIDGVLSEDMYDTVSAFYNNEVRGSAQLSYDSNYKAYFAYLTIYGNDGESGSVQFKIWDASSGNIFEATINSELSVNYTQDQILGNLTSPVDFENTRFVDQQIHFNSGWNWISFNVNDPNFGNIDELSKYLSLETGDRILSHSPSLLATYYKDDFAPENSQWNGGIVEAGGLSSSKMYKFNIYNEQDLVIQGESVNIQDWSFEIKQGWNWIPYVLDNNILLEEGLSNFEPNEGDVIKSQNQFSIYDPLNGWSGTLQYLEKGKGYMIKSENDQTFRYPNFLNFAQTTKQHIGFRTFKESKNNLDSIRYSKFSESMNMVVQLPDGFDELYVYNEKGELRGVEKNQSHTNKRLRFITIYGNNDTSKLVFYKGKGLKQFATSKTFNFIADAVMGTVRNPITLESLSTLEERVIVYPNSFKAELSVQISLLENRHVSIRLYDITGQQVYTKNRSFNEGTNIVKISDQDVIKTGVYLLRVSSSEFDQIFKVIKTE